MVKSFAFELSSIGLKKGDRVIIYMPTIPQSIAVMLACSRLGLIHSVVFAGFSAESLKDRINDCKASAVITVDSFLRNGKVITTKNTVNAALEFGCPSIKHLIIYNHNNTEFVKKDIDVIWNENLTKRSIDLDPIQMNSEDILFILYTSGSTGKPKGIVHSTGGYLLNCMLTNNWVFDLKDDDIFWCTADIGWITGHSYVVYGPLSMGATILIYDGAPTYPHIGRFWEIIEKNHVSIFYTAPTAIRTLMKLGENLPEDFDLESLRLLGTVGEPINPKAWEWYHSKIGSSKCPVVDTWWQTETGANMIAPIPGVTNTIPGTCTKPLPGIDVGIVDNDGIEIDEGPWQEIVNPKNGKKIGLIGAGPASLTVARDLLPLGYEVTIFEKDNKPGGLMRTNIPSFRLPEEVLDEEVYRIIKMGAELKTNSYIDSLENVIDSFDAVFVGTGAPKGKDLEIPGRKEASENIHIGIDWLTSIAFEHTKSIGKKVIVIGGGNTAMDLSLIHI